MLHNPCWAFVVAGQGLVHTTCGQHDKRSSIPHMPPRPPPLLPHCYRRASSWWRARRSGAPCSASRWSPAPPTWPLSRKRVRCGHTLYSLLLPVRSLHACAAAAAAGPGAALPCCRRSHASGARSWVSRPRCCCSCRPPKSCPCTRPPTNPPTPRHAPCSQARAGQHQCSVQPQRPGGAPPGRLPPHPWPHDGWAEGVTGGRGVGRSSGGAAKFALPCPPHPLLAMSLWSRAASCHTHCAPPLHPAPRPLFTLQATCGCRRARSGATAWTWGCA